MERAVTPWYDAVNALVFALGVNEHMHENIDYFICLFCILMTMNRGGKNDCCLPSCKPIGCAEKPVARLKARASPLRRASQALGWDRLPFDDLIRSGSGTSIRHVVVIGRTSFWPELSPEEVLTPNNSPCSRTYNFRAYPINSSIRRSLFTICIL